MSVGKHPYNKNRSAIRALPFPHPPRSILEQALLISPAVQFSHLSPTLWISAPVEASFFWFMVMVSYLDIVSTLLPGEFPKMQSWSCHSPTLRPYCFLLSLQNKTQGFLHCKAFSAWPPWILTAHHILLAGKTTLVLIARTPQGLLKSTSLLVMLPLIWGHFPHLFAYLSHYWTVKTQIRNYL